MDHGGGSIVAAARYRRGMVFGGWVLRACCIAFVFIPGLAVRAGADAALPRIRPVDARAASLLARGSRESPTFAALVASLEQSDTIMHVQERPPDPRHPMGATRLVARAGGFRYLRISLEAGLPDESAIALLGHELHHAWEIARARWVVDEATLVRLYARIGRVHDHDGSTRADSSGARAAGAKVFAEVRRHAMASD
jgi:hypothetical protein